MQRRQIAAGAHHLETDDAGILGMLRRSQAGFNFGIVNRNIAFIQHARIEAHGFAGDKDRFVGSNRNSFDIIAGNQPEHHVFHQVRDG